MADTDTTIELETPAEAAAPEVELTAPEPAKKPASDPEAGIEKLSKQLEDERRDKLAAQSRAQAAESDAATARHAEVAARTEAHTSNLNTVTTAIAALTQAMDQGEAQYAEALAAGDHARAAKINREMNQNAAKLQKLEDGKVALESAPKPTARATPAADPVERLASQLSPKSAAWVRAHPEFAVGSKYQKMVAAHQMAMADGISADTDAYFESIEDTLKLRQAVAADPVIEVDTAPQRATGGRSTAPAAAPVSRSGSSSGGSSKRVIRLSAEQQEAARISGMTNQEYANSLAEIQEEQRRLN